jgi:tetratricopeptide (TPR) repeat protein
MFAEALAELRQAVQLTNNAPIAQASFAEALAESGDRRGATEVLHELQARAKSRYVSAYDVSMIYAALGDNNRAFEWLAKAEHDHASFLPYITWDRRADGLRSDPRFSVLLQRLRLRRCDHGAPRAAVTWIIHCRVEQAFRPAAYGPGNMRAPAEHGFYNRSPPDGRILRGQQNSCGRRSRQER